jgi:hypothetical protein
MPWLGMASMVRPSASRRFAVSPVTRLLLLYVTPPLYRLKPPSHHIAVVLSALAEGLDASAAERVFGFRQATITHWLARAGEHAQSLHEHCFRTLEIPHLQLDELRDLPALLHTGASFCGWPLIRSTSVLPVLQLGPRTQTMAHLLVHSIRQLLAPGCLPLFTSDGLNWYFSALTAHVGHWLVLGRRGRKARW